MIKKILFIALVASMMSCGKKDLKTPGGFTYTHVSTDGQKVQEGDYVYITIAMIGSDGTILQEIGEGPRMPIMQMPTADKPLPMPNPVVDMLMNGALGDSMTLIMPIDSLPNKENPALAGMEYVKYVTCIKKIKDETGYKAEMEEERLKAEIEAESGKARLDEVALKTEQIIQDYKDGKLDVQTTPEGLKYVIHEQGDGEFGAVGKRASVHYYGAFMDGKRFDSSFLRGTPYPFTVGRGEVIQGWDIGIPLLKKGASASLFIPYNLAYGAAGKPPSIPEKADLMFYVELADVN
jgi:FKBP-type peptidyl-prolyl cis-trans isomerase FkpA